MKAAPRFKKSLTFSDLTIKSINKSYITIKVCVCVAYFSK